MKKILCVSIPILLLISGIVVFGYLFAGNTSGKRSTLGFDNSYSHDDAAELTTNFDNNAPELSIFNLQRLLQTKSVPIDDNEDPGSNPPNDYFGILGNPSYPLKELEISDADEIVVIIRPSANLKSDKLDAYIACNTEVVRQVKDELCYFYTPVGTTPYFYVSIYKNGFAIKKDIGIFGVHLSKLGDEFKPVKRTNAENSGTIACIGDNEFLSLISK